MTIKQSEHLENASQQKGFKCFDECIGMMSETARLQPCDVLLLKKQWHAAARRRRMAIRAQRVQYNEELGLTQYGTQLNRTEEQKNCVNKRQLDEGNVTEGGIDHLLILACSAELMSKSEDGFPGACRNDQNNKGSNTNPITQQLENTVIDATVTGKQHDGMPASANVRGEKDGICWQGRTPRLSQIRHQARSKNHLFVQDRNGEHAHGHMQGRAPRLSQIRRQARSKNHLLVQETIGEYTCRHLQKKAIGLGHISKNHLLLQERIGEYTFGHMQGRITRLSQVRRLARSKSKLLVQEGVGEHAHRCLDCHNSEVNVETENKMMSVKGRIRLSHVKHQARMGNQHVVTPQYAGVSDRDEGAASSG